MPKETLQNKTPEIVRTNLICTNHYFNIPTDNNVDFRVRRTIVLEAYDILLKKNGGKLLVHNDFLGTDIEITRRISRKKASNNSVRHWQSTYAILKIINVVKYASSTEIMHLPAKEGMQQNSGFSYIIPLEYTFRHPTKTYLNFTVELIVGEIVLERQGKRYVQYSVELMEIKKPKAVNPTYLYADLPSALFYAAKLQLFHKPARGRADFLFLPCRQQACHPYDSLCGGMGSMAAACIYPSFCLETKGPKIQGRHHRSLRSKRALPRHVGRGPRTQPGLLLAFPHTVYVGMRCERACHPCAGMCGGLGSMPAAWPCLVYALFMPSM